MEFLELEIKALPETKYALVGRILKSAFKAVRVPLILLTRAG
uniref:Uncharacterized protein n=1 Tax=Candidatus Kentrum sp. TC TaxID=2126339 RepID=A0A450ZER0_9GAMM|nr:MAG: hypothetical protein BECKTC1821D_GA0114238_11612 [Candidatus Kentron sp. TC]VFK64689.1 MAG: hypothetical protein BECKTC1821F_GA0114240_11392 [Candidatus Kentron sp. TC]